MTPTQLKALKLMKSRGPLTRTQFSRLMWPSSPSWKNREAPGVAVRRNGAKLINKLVAEGYVKAYDDKAMLTHKGVAAVVRQIRNEQVQTKYSALCHTSRLCGMPSGKVHRLWGRVTCNSCITLKRRADARKRK